jgi:hypothetical protein
MWTKDGQVFGLHSEVRAHCTRTSFPSVMTDEMVEAAGYERVIQKPAIFDPETQMAVEIAPEKVDGVWEQRWSVANLPPEAVLANRKEKREAAVSAITVTTTAGNTYQGDEVSINRMNAAITVMMATGQSVPWVLADNSIVTVNAAELTEALALSAAEVARLWVAPYQP